MKEIDRDREEFEREGQITSKVILTPNPQYRTVREAVWDWGRGLAVKNGERA
jgi:hypothetical protein